MKKVTIFLLISIGFISCELFMKDSKPEDSKETKRLVTKANSAEEMQIAAIQELFTFYSASEKNYSFYEIYYSTNYLLNYNPIRQTLSVSTDLCSGWAVHYINVSEELLGKLSRENVPFEKFDMYLTKESDTMKWGKIDTNISCIKPK